MTKQNESSERSTQASSGYAMLFVALILLVATVASFIYGGKNLDGGGTPKGVSTTPEFSVIPGPDDRIDRSTEMGVAGIIGGIVGVILTVLTLCGFFVVDPNYARVLVLFGSYRGSVRDPGFYWTNPFMSKLKVSLRANNFNSDKLKVNDLLGNPIEIAAVVVWQVRETAKAVFDVENFHLFVQVQSESAVRMVAARHPYDDGQAGDVKTTLRGSSDVVAEELRTELGQRLDRAGIEVIEARLSHLAYAPEVAAAMLQRQQAAAVIAARSMIVDGAVGMVEMALQHLSEKKVVTLDDERKATLVGNLLVVLCSHENPTPVLNTGSLYN